MSRQQGVPLLVKRAFDITAAALTLVVLAPLLLVVALSVGLTMGRPVFFRQERIGRNCKPFRMIKFRTMRHVPGAIGDGTQDAARLTPIGRFLRSTSIDELPELWNVITGAMSLVGPRPLLPRYLPRYTSAQLRRHDVLPGLTGWAQVNGRNMTSWNERFENDLWYADNWSVILDLRIIVRTVGTVVGRRGVSSEGHATMHEFMGSEQQSDARGREEPPGEAPPAMHR